MGASTIENDISKIEWRWLASKIVMGRGTVFPSSPTISGGESGIIENSCSTSREKSNLPNLTLKFRMGEGILGVFRCTKEITIRLMVFENE